MDSGCLFHICPDKTLFTNYKFFNGLIVMMGNNACCRVVGKSFIRLKLSYGVINKLDDIKHVPELKRNLISLWMLDKSGSSVKLE